MFSFFVNELSMQNKFIIENKDFHHIVNVIKLKIGEKIFCIYNNKKYLCSIETIEKNYIIANIINEVLHNNQQIKINLIVGLIREQKWDYILQKSTELGVDKIIPVEFKRNVVTIDQRKLQNKITRWNEICLSAAKQSKRVSIPKVCEVVKNLDELKNYLGELNLVAYENNKDMSLKEYLKSEFNTISIVIGPEGGFETKEISQLKKLGFNIIGLGQNILRAETACLYFVSTIIYEKT
ncbi:16S rRNA (uracil1498-N3)-methyltransferase [Spiroplasma gladiatoris]|uniref:Ribosomal RNA small subunit methyltransferase E n=1 Tax=Spiroplasma gladiatoris TaxID=2143 RepID=A0A4P7AHC6_9MOLU|nr:16S rRNA (uracil(1498)-N(3))-methyltransferase [Spiroplasma gladiatoris]QBQ07587.1 16S rRNA (uracil1498-N3)-methyltransferase [Spiroplasma gladiatoris]